MNSKKNAKSRVTVAEYLSQQIHLSGIPQKEIAERMNYKKPNIITMFKQGSTKLPVNKVKEMADILGVDRVYLLRLVMLEYSPETWAALEELIGSGNMTTDNERKILELTRSTAEGLDVGPKTADEETEYRKMVLKWKEREEQELNKKTVLVENVK